MNFSFQIAVVMFVIFGCIKSAEYDAKKLEYKIVIKHRPYSSSYNLSKNIKEFLGKKLKIEAVDDYVSPDNDISFSKKDNIIELSENYEFYSKHHPFGDKIPSPVVGANNTLILLRRKTKTQPKKSQTLAIISDKALMTALQDIDLNLLFGDQSFGSITNTKLHEANFIVVDEKILESRKFDNFAVHKTSIPIHRNNWVIPRSLKRVLEKTELENEFDALLNNDSFHFLQDFTAKVH